MSLVLVANLSFHVLFNRLITCYIPVYCLDQICLINLLTSSSSFASREVSVEYYLTHSESSSGSLTNLVLFHKRNHFFHFIKCVLTVLLPVNHFFYFIKCLLTVLLPVPLYFTVAHAFMNPLNSLINTQAFIFQSVAQKSSFGRQYKFHFIELHH